MPCAKGFIANYVGLESSHDQHVGVSQNSVPHKRAERYRPPPSFLVVFHTLFECNANDTYLLRMTHVDLPLLWLRWLIVLLRVHSRVAFEDRGCSLLWLSSHCSSAPKLCRFVELLIESPGRLVFSHCCWVSPSRAGVLNEDRAPSLTSDSNTALVSKAQLNNLLIVFAYIWFYASICF